MALGTLKTPIYPIFYLRKGGLGIRVEAESLEAIFWLMFVLNPGRFSSSAPG